MVKSCRKKTTPFLNEEGQQNANVMIVYKVELKFNHVNNPYVEDKESRGYEQLASTLLWMELNSMHFSLSNRSYKFITIIAGRGNPLFIFI
jgi:hypothetical protein